MQVLQHMGVGGSIVEDHRDTEGETLRHAILLQLMHRPYLAVLLKNVTRHPASGIRAGLRSRSRRESEVFGWSRSQTPKSTRSRNF